MSSVNNVCRLCLSKDNLVWVFDKRLDSENMKDVISITTGVEIYENDVISQMICEKCYRISVRMYQFRKASQKHDRYLKKLYKDMHKTSSVDHDNPSMGLRIETENKVEPKMNTKEVGRSHQNFHQTVRDLLKIYPRLKLPSICLKSNIEPCVMIEMEMVENFSKELFNGGQKCLRLPEPENRMTKNSSSPESTLSESTDENLNEGDSFSDDEPDGIDKPFKRKKRRLSDSDLFSDDETTEPLPMKKATCQSAEQLCPDESVPLFLCSICNSVHNNVRELKRHQFKHLSCQFCGSKFKTIGSKKAHIRSLCAIKKIMDHLPSVKLAKIELDQRIRTKYPAAFVGYPLISGQQLNSSSTETSGYKPPGSEDDTMPGNQTSEKDKRVAGWNGGCHDNGDIIEILSDDDIMPSTTCNITPVPGKKIVAVSNITQRILNSEISATNSLIFTKNPVISTTLPVISSTPPINSTTSVSFTTPQTISNTSVLSTTPPSISNSSSRNSTTSVIQTTPLVISNSSSVISTTSVVIHTTPLVISTTTPAISTTIPVVSTTPPDISITSKTSEDSVSSVAVVKPQIKIRNSTVLDTIDMELSDIKLFKELLTKNSAFSIKKEDSSQTELPCNKSISVNEIGQPKQFKNLKNLLFSYKIPILSKKGDYQVRYDYNFSNSKPRRSKKKKLCLWAHLPPIDVKVANRYSNNQGALRKIIPAFTSEVGTPNISTPALTSNCTTTTLNTFDHSYSTVPNQQTYNRSNSFSTPVNSFTGSSNVHVYTQVVPSNIGVVNEAPYLFLGTNTAEQQSKTNTANSLAASNVQMYPQSVNMSSSVVSNFGVANKVSVANDPTYVVPGSNISYLNDIRSPPNVNPFGIPNMAGPTSSPAFSQNSTNAPSISNSRSLMYNMQNSLAVQTKVPDPVPNPLPITNASGYNEAGPVFGSIRVKSVWELT